MIIIKIDLLYIEKYLTTGSTSMSNLEVVEGLPLEAELVHAEVDKRNEVLVLNFEAPGEDRELKVILTKKNEIIPPWQRDTPK